MSTTEKLFSYGTLQLSEVQTAIFGRLLVGKQDHLLGYRLEKLKMTDGDVFAKSNRIIHPIAVYTGRSDDKVEGTVFDISSAELMAADHYEVADYQRVQVCLGSGLEAWVYVERVKQVEDSSLGRKIMNSQALEAFVTDILRDNKGGDLVSLDISQISNIADYMVICTATSNRHAKALLKHVFNEVKQNGVVPFGVEGEQNGDWILIDLGDVIIHIMQANTRTFYNLERLWSGMEEGKQG